jgi:myo-inositol 2-dehydrogenase / D-chiro-inositol 1-dehydrogenase
MQRETTSTFTRRDFVKSSAAAATSAALFSALGTNFAHAQGSDLIKVGVVGCGGRGSGAAANVLEGAQVAGAKAEIYSVGDVFEGQAKGLGGKHNVQRERVFAGLDNYKEVIGSGVDMVILATPPGFRPMHFKAAIDAGKHVFFEKPVAVDPTGIRMVLEASEQASQKGLAVVTGTQRRHETNYLETVKRIHDGAIGDVLHMSVYWNGGGIWSRPRQPNQSDAEYQINNWYHYIWLSGDQICEQHIHNIDVANWVMNSHPISAYGMGGRQVRKEPGQIWDHFAIEYEYPNGGRVMSMCRHWGQSDDNVSEFAIGTKGTANPGGWIRTHDGKRETFKNERSGYVQEHADLIKSFTDGKPLNEGKQVAYSTLTAIMGRESCYTGRKITWEQALNSKLDTFPKNLTLKSALPEPPVPMPDKNEPV